MKLDKFETLVEGRPVYTSKLSKTGGYIATGILFLVVGGLIYWKFFRVPKFVFINKDVLKNRIQFKMDNSDRIYYIDGGGSIKVGKSIIYSELIKQPDSDLIIGINLTQKLGDKIVKNKMINY